MHSLLLSSIVFGEKWFAYVVEFETKVLIKVCMTKIVFTCFMILKIQERGAQMPYNLWWA